MPSKVCITVAHPDDETLWAGGLAIRLKCDIICCSIPRRDPERVLKFFNACQELGCRGILLPVFEDYPLDLSLLDLEKYDHIITHNEAGEYGHANHKQLHWHICAEYPHKLLSFFGYGWSGEDIGLTTDESERKLRALKCYDHTTEIDGEPKWSALIKRYKLDLARETHALA